ncbi:MAG: hypothetical protein ACYDEY_05630 [Acidimicrobiales bacterium]
MTTYPGTDFVLVYAVKNTKLRPLPARADRTVRTAERRTGCRACGCARCRYQDRLAGLAWASGGRSGVQGRQCRALSLQG